MYVGIGTWDRAWVVRNRQEDHLDWLKDYYDQGHLMNDIVELGDTGISRAEALESELELINEHRPKFNRNFRLNATCKLDKEMHDLIFELRENGLSYSAIGKELELGTMLIYRVINGKTKKYEQFQSA